MRFGQGPARGSTTAMALIDVPADTRHLRDAEAAHALFAALELEPVEVAAFAYLGRDQQLLGLRHTRPGARDWLDLPIRDVAADALAFDASAVVMAHNHPGGDPTPSVADREATRQLARALKALEVRLLDHLIVAAQGVVSFRGLGLL